MAFDPEKINSRAFDYYQRLGRVRDLVDNHFDEHIPLSRAAGAACLESTYFSAFFRNKTGVRFRDWLSYQRCQRAIELMRTRNLSITAIAFEVGYRDIRTFERSFKRCTGLTPIAFKRRVRPS